MVPIPLKLVTRLSPQLTRRPRPILNTMIRGMGAVAIVSALAGCSVGMAMSGQAEPNLGVFGVGSSRGQVELELGSAIASSTDVNGLRTAIDECGTRSMGE